MRFSERISKKPIRATLQIEAIDDALRNKLWNIICSTFLNRLLPEVVASEQLLFKTWWHTFFKLPIDTIPNSTNELVEKIRTWYFKAEWYEIYDLLEFLIDFDRKYSRDKFDKLCNSVLEDEMSGYRVINYLITPITDEKEIREIEIALENARKFKLPGVFDHIDSAVSKLADRERPDYRNSIKESISAVESLSRIIAEKPKASLDDALKIIEDKIGLHPALKKGFLAIYGYTSDDDGIRHALLDHSKCDFEDAKYMLVSCSAFINYLIVKSEKSKITFG